MTKSKLKVMIKSDGTPGGTSLVVNSVDITKKYNVISIYFSAYARYNNLVSEEYSGSLSQDVYINWEIEEKDDNGLYKVIRYRYDPRESKIYKTPLGKGKIGDSVDPQFLTDTDKRAYDLTNDFKTIDEVIEVIDISDKK